MSPNRSNVTINKKKKKKQSYHAHITILNSIRLFVIIVIIFNNLCDYRLRHNINKSVYHVNRTDKILLLITIK